MKGIAISVLMLVCASGHAHESGERPTFGGKRLAVTINVKAGAKAGEVVWATPASDPLKHAFDVVFFQGITQNEDLAIQGAVVSNGKAGAWTDAYLEAEANGRFWAKIALSGPAGARVKLRAVVKTGAKGAFEIFGVHAAPNEEEAGGSARAPSSSQRFKLDTLSQTLPIPAPDGPAMPKVHERAEWGAKKATKPYEPMVPVRISVHHTETIQPFSKDDAIAEMRSIQSFHQHGRGWIDIGYHFVIDGSGRVWRGRPLGVIGAHVKDKNDGNVGISLMGDFGPPHNQHPSNAQIDSLVALMKWLTYTYKIPVERIKGHRDQEDTSCPGDILYAQLPAIRARVAAPDAVAGPSLPTVPSVTTLFEKIGGALRAAP